MPAETATSPPSLPATIPSTSPGATPSLTHATSTITTPQTTQSTTAPIIITSTENEKTSTARRDRSHFKGKFPGFMTPTQRQDVLAIKQQLADALGENGPLYWDSLKDFVAGKLNRQEFDFYANLYLSQENAYLHNAFILSTVHNAQTAYPPTSKHRAVGWSKRRRGKDGSVIDGGQYRDPAKRKLKMDIMSLSKADRDRLKALVKAGDNEKIRPFVKEVLGPRISRVPPLPLPAEQLPPTFNTDYARGLLAPLCTDLKELPGPETLHARMTSIALEQGLIGGVAEDVVNAMLFATESYIKSAIANAVTKRRVNRSVGVKLRRDTPETRAAALEQIISQRQDTQPEAAALSPQQTVADTEMTLSLPSSLASKGSAEVCSARSETSDRQSISSSMSSIDTLVDSITLRDLAFSFAVSPYVLVETPLNAEKLTVMLTDSENEETDDDLGDSSSEDVFDL
ncbi:transcriptional regulator of RNA polII, SAGA, subunit-domain-containing protein [Dichotomocladium elegans]|nr:transcriptional regulator of RNA polII, SAGA, subunit-domain-containing protein [Dichotomocladium elegans]